MPNPVRIASGSVSPLAGVQAIHDCVDSAHGPCTIQLAAKVFVVRRSCLGDKLDRTEASMILSTENVTVTNLRCGESGVVVEIGGLGSWLG